MMITQGTTQSDLQGVAALLEVIGSPDKAKARLKELVDASKRAREDEQAAVDAQANAQKILDEADKIQNKLDTREKVVSEREDAHDVASSVLDNATRSLKEKQKSFDENVANHSQYLLDAKTSFRKEYDAKTKELIQREVKVSSREAAVEALYTEYTQKLEAFKKLVG